MVEQSDKLISAHARFVGIRTAFPAKQHVQVHERYVRLYQAALQQLNDLGFPTQEFRIPLMN